MLATSVPRSARTSGERIASHLPQCRVGNVTRAGVRCDKHCAISGEGARICHSRPLPETRLSGLPRAPLPRDAGVHELRRATALGCRMYRHRLNLYGTIHRELAHAHKDSPEINFPRPSNHPMPKPQRPNKFEGPSTNDSNSRPNRSCGQSPARRGRSFEPSNLVLDCDLVLVHWPFPDKSGSY
jgi:hypothetical protein